MAEGEDSGHIPAGLSKLAPAPDRSWALHIGGEGEPDVTAELAQQLMEEGDADLDVAALRVRDLSPDENRLDVIPRSRGHLHDAPGAGG